MPRKRHNSRHTNPKRKQAMKTIKAAKNLVKAIRADVRKACKRINSIAKDYFAAYKVEDKNGTYQMEWTEKAAFAWISYCGEDCRIQNTFTRETVFARKQFI
jgi:hypothetical protein